MGVCYQELDLDMVFSFQPQLNLLYLGQIY